MPNIAQVLKEEMARVSRREIKKATATLHRSSAIYRREIAALKRHNAELEREVKALSRERAKSSVSTPASAKSSHRFSATGLRTLRHRLGLSAAQLGSLVGVSEQSIYNWETKVATPRSAYLPAIVRLRGMGRREAARLLEGGKKRAK